MAAPARVVECRFFAGMTIPEMAEALGIAEATVSRDWQLRGRGSTGRWRRVLSDGVLTRPLVTAIDYPPIRARPARPSSTQGWSSGSALFHHSTKMR